MYTNCHQMLTIASAFGAPPVFPGPSCGIYDVPILLAFTQSRNRFGPFILATSHLDIRVGFLACKVVTRGYMGVKSRSNSFRG